MDKETENKENKKDQLLTNDEEVNLEKKESKDIQDTI